MNLDNLLNTLPLDVRESPAIQGMVVLIRTLFEQLDKSQAQLQATQEKLTKAEERITVLEKELAKFRKTPKRPKFRPNEMEPRNRANKPSLDAPTDFSDVSLARKEISEVTIRPDHVPTEARFKGCQTFVVQEVGIIAKEITYKLEVWQGVDGTIFRAKLPEELKGRHYGPVLHAFATSLYAHGMTQPTIHELPNRYWH